MGQESFDQYIILLYGTQDQVGFQTQQVIMDPSMRKGVAVRNKLLIDVFKE